MDGFSAENWAKLSNAERMEYCQQAAREAESYSRSAAPELRSVYKQLADQWRALATEIERSSKWSA
jgi:hypothetical protein